MKKHFKSISLCILIAVGFSSCTTDDNSLDPTNLGGYVHLTDSEISLFDTNADLNLNLITNSGVTVTAVEILEDSLSGAVIANATVSGETASFNSSTLGEFVFIDDDDVAHDTGDFPIFISSTLSNGKKAGDPTTVHVVDAISFDKEPGSVKFMDSTTTILSYETFTHSATIDDVIFSWKKNKLGTYVESDLVLNVEKDSINLADIDYEAFDAGANDTIYYKFVANSGDLSQEIVAKIAILPQSFGAATNATLSAATGKNEYNLGSGEFAIEGETGEMSFTAPSGFDLAVDFVKVTVPAMDAEDYFNNTDLFEAEDAYDAGVKLSSIVAVSNGDVYIYKVTRTITRVIVNDDDEEEEVEEDFVFYGIIKIDNTIVVNGTANSFEFKYAEGTIIR
jgi:hypothetical protein